MKAINATELKAHLSKYLRMASRGSRIVVMDRNEPVAQLGRYRRRICHGANVWNRKGVFGEARRTGAG